MRLRQRRWATTGLLSVSAESQLMCMERAELRQKLCGFKGCSYILVSLLPCVNNTIIRVYSLLDCWRSGDHQAQLQGWQKGKEPIEQKQRQYDKQPPALHLAALECPCACYS